MRAVHFFGSGDCGLMVSNSLHDGFPEAKSIITVIKPHLFPLRRGHGALQKTMGKSVPPARKPRQSAVADTGANKKVFPLIARQNSKCLLNEPWRSFPLPIEYQGNVRPREPNQLCKFLLFKPGPHNCRRQFVISNLELVLTQQFLPCQCVHPFIIYCSQRLTFCQVEF